MTSKKVVLKNVNMEKVKRETDKLIDDLEELEKILQYDGYNVDYLQSELQKKEVYHYEY